MTAPAAALFVLLLAAPIAAPFSTVAVALEAAANGSGRVPTPGDDKPVKAIDAWLKAYRAGKIDLRSPKDIAKGCIADKFGLMPRGLVGTFSARQELEALLEAAVALQTEAAAAAVLEVAAIGLDHAKFKFKPEMVPFTVRSVADRYTARFESDAALHYLRSMARGEAKTDRTYGTGQRVAALRALGQRQDGETRALCEVALTAAEMPLRLAAAESLTVLADPAAGPTLTRALAGEHEDAVVGAIVGALRVLYADYLVRGRPAAAIDAKGADGDQGAPPGDAGKDASDKDGKDAKDGKAAAVAPAPAPAPAPKALTADVEAAIAAVTTAIGQSGWRGDMHLIQFVRDMDARSAVPQLIEVLQRFQDHPELIQSGDLSRLQQHRAHEALATLTGAVFGPDDVASWRRFWDQEGAKLLGAARSAEPRGKVVETASGFFGIPVRGNRVLFVVDLSGSMEFRMKLRPGELEATAADEVAGETRLAFAKRQLKTVLEALPDTSLLNIITFNGRREAAVWQKDLVPTSDRNKKKALEYIMGWTAIYPPPNERDGGTNMWSGLETALRMKSTVYGERDDDAVDEMFMVSDGAPSVGEVIDPIEILRLVSEANRFAKIRINTVFITSPNDKDPKNLSLPPDELMQRLAEENGGTFVHLIR